MSPPPTDTDPQAQFACGTTPYGWRTVAIVSVDGTPADVSGRFRQSLDEAAATRRIAVAAPAKARYLARGYVTASPIEGEAEVDIVWTCSRRTSSGPSD